MELLITIAYIFLVRLVFFDYKLMRFNLFWKFMVFGLYVAAAMTEVIFLGQYAPYSKEAFAQAYVVQMAPEYGGLVKDVYVTSNQQVKKGDPLFQMDKEPFENKVNEYEAKLAAAETDVSELGQQLEEAKANTSRTRAELALAELELKQYSNAAEQQAVSQVRLEQMQKQAASLKAELEGNLATEKSAQLALESNSGDQPTGVAEARALLDSARYNLEQTTIRAPSDGYPTNVQLFPGSFVRLKTPVMSFVSSDETWIIAKIRQQGAQHVQAGDKGEIAFEMYPGKVFPVVVESITWASGNAQGVPSGVLPTEQSIRPIWEYVVRLRLEKESPEYPVRFGATALVAIYSTDAADFLKVLRQIEIRSESFLNYLYNPF